MDEHGKCSYVLVGHYDRQSLVNCIMTLHYASCAPSSCHIQSREHSLVDLVQVDKHELVFECGIHHRDLRIVDPHIATPSPSAIFIRLSMLLDTRLLHHHC